MIRPPEFAMSQTALEEIATLPRLGTILHLGAGFGADLPACLASRARRIVLVEPAPEAQAALRGAAAGDARVRILPVAVAAEAGPALLREVSFAALSSLQAPAPALHALYPGLRKTGAVPVEARPLATLLSDAGIAGEDDAPAVLIVDAPGVESTIVADLLRLTPDNRPAHVVLRAGAEAFYEGGQPFADLRAALVAGGYQIEAESAEDPDFPEAHLTLDARALELQELRVRLAELEAARTAEAAARTAAEGRAEELSQRVSALKAEVEARKSEREEHKGRAKELEAQVKALKAEREELDQELQRLQARQRRLEDELVRAEAQIVLVRDLMRLPEGAPVETKRRKTGRG